MFVSEKQEGIFHNLRFGHFIELANRNDRACLTLDCSSINNDVPWRFKTEADKSNFQTCYYNVGDDEQVYNEFVSKQINESETTGKFSLYYSP